MSGDIIVGIDNLSLLILGLLFAVEIYGYIIGNNILLIIGLVAIVLVYVVRIRNRSRVRELGLNILSLEKQIKINKSGIDLLRSLIDLLLPLSPGNHELT